MSAKQRIGRLLCWTSIPLAAVAVAFAWRFFFRLFPVWRAENLPEPIPPAPEDGWFVTLRQNFRVALYEMDTQYVESIETYFSVSILALLFAVWLFWYGRRLISGPPPAAAVTRGRQRAGRVLQWLSLFPALLGLGLIVYNGPHAWRILTRPPRQPRAPESKDPDLVETLYNGFVSVSDFMTSIDESFVMGAFTLGWQLLGGALVVYLLARWLRRA